MTASVHNQMSFDLLDARDLSIEEAANTLKVSTATVRNWIKAGDLIASQSNTIPQTSISQLKANVIGKSRLTKRANKSHASTHDHEKVQNNFSIRLSQLKDKDHDTIGDEYQSSLSNSYRNTEGVYYTPIDIARQILKDVSGDVSTMTFLDPCCGSGNFLIAAIERGFHPDKVFGFDIDPIAVEIAQTRLSAFSKKTDSNLKVMDFLAACLEHPVRFATQYDVIATNPPWGKKLSKETKNAYCERLGSKSSLDTAEMFFLASMKVITPTGHLGMLLPDALFNISSFEFTRKIILEKQIISLMDFDKPFTGLVTKAKSIMLRNVGSVKGGSQIVCRQRGKEHSRDQCDFSHTPKHIFNFTCSPIEAKAIEKFFASPHKTLLVGAKWGLGIVTGNNEKFVSNQPDEGLLPVYKGAEICAGKLPDPTSFIPSDLSLYQQVAPRELYFAKEKLIYRFISSRLVFHHDTEQKLFLNSVNFVIPDQSLGVEQWKIAWLFNTEIVNWVFGKVFETHKILRSDLESLPIFHEYLNAVEVPSEEGLLTYLKLGKETDGTYRSQE